jgi:uncharacterized protein YyaL (SSP411 family)
MSAHSNRLAREKSPYLLQHAANPVDWYPWGEEAFAKAVRENKPIFLSIGYSTCHWCHVMERESFEDDSVAALLNEHFVSVKVDREERPDVDRVYMTAMQAMGMGGGWPLTVFMTPELQPFFGGTYFPPHSVPGRIGMMELLPRVSEAWRTQREQLVANGERVFRMLESLSAADQREAHAMHPFAELMRQCEEALERSHDAEAGGFGTAPKFPSTANLDFLLRRYAREPQAHGHARVMAVAQLHAMRAGGIHDHLGGGFHRYSTDRTWLTPHFEKMLYDQALIASAMLDGFQVTGDTRLSDTARGIFDYVRRDLRSPEGAFYSAEDADSEGEEGRFYVWTPAELERVLGAEMAGMFAQRYGVTARGNFEHGTSILHEVQALEEVAAAAGLTSEAAEAQLGAARAALLAARSERIRPHRDDKVITAWNALMIGAFAHGARVLGDASLAHDAERAFEFVWTQLRDERTGALLRRWREGDAAGEGQLDDHAYLAHAALELYAATHDVKWLERALQITTVMLARFWDEKDGACFESPAGDPHVRVRMKDGFDGAELAGNSVAAMNLLRLSGLLERDDLRECADRTLHYYAARLAGNAYAMPRLLCAMDMASYAARHVVIAGEQGADRDALVAVHRHGYRPFDELLVADAAARPLLARLAAFAATLQPVQDKATAFVCLDHTCQLPVTEPAMFAAQLGQAVPPLPSESR